MIYLLHIKANPLNIYRDNSSLKLQRNSYFHAANTLSIGHGYYDVA